MAKVALFIKTRSKSGKRDEVRDLWEQHLKARAEANIAQEVYFFCYDNEDPDKFLLFEVYNDPAALDENARSDWFAAYMEEVGPLLDDMTDLFRRQGEDASLSRSEALRRSRMIMIEEVVNEGPDGQPQFSYAYPIFWAPFTLIGDGVGSLQ